MDAPADFSKKNRVVSRLAPSPTGALHLGNIRTFLWAWLSARAQNGRVIMRVEDLDSPRVKPGLNEKILDDLRWLGFDWDEGPDLGSPSAAAPNPYIQTQRREYYAQIHQRLLSRDAIYPCVCTRGDIAASQSAPHEGESQGGAGEGEGELRYPGLCLGRFKNVEEARAAGGREPAWRLKTAPGSVRFDDLLRGPQSFDVSAEVGDFVVAKGVNNPAYQLAVVADDIAMGVTEVVRGDDLLSSTARQLLIYRLLKAAPPVYGHVPLVVGPDGKRLAKRHGDARVASFREQGHNPRRIIATLARWSGLNCGDEATPAELIPAWSWKKVSRERVVLTPEKLAEINK
jgi:glutamyl-tRNA synthetase